MAVVLNGPFTFTAVNDKLELPAPESPAEYEIQITGAGTLTIEFQDSLDGGTTYVAVQVLNVSTGAGAANMTAAGIFRAGGGGQGGAIFRRPRLICTAFTSGTLVGRVASILRP
jgi:hypothetical protein